MKPECQKVIDRAKAMMEAAKTEEELAAAKINMEAAESFVLAMMFSGSAMDKLS